jgi:hypothetical protein
MIRACRSMSGPAQEACIGAQLEKLGVGRR